MMFYIENRKLMLDLQDGSDSTKIDCSDLDTDLNGEGQILIYTDVTMEPEEINVEK